MTTSLPAVRLGAQQPRVSSHPSSAVTSAAADDAIEFAALAGLHLDEWQQLVLRSALGERQDGKWSAFEVALIVGRQNGKGSVLEARELAGLFLFGEELILHSAHEFKTSVEAFRRVQLLVTNYDHLGKLVKIIRTASGSEGIELLNGNRLRFVARSSGSGRGFSGDCVILDEAYNLDAGSMAALLPTLSARPNPQLWYTSSAGMESSQQLMRVRERGRVGSPRLSYCEWSASEDADLDDREAWAQANPALGIRIDEEFVESEREALPEVEFARERLGIWSDSRRGGVIDPLKWASLADPRSKVLDPVAFAVDVTPERSSASVAIAGRRADGLSHVEIVDNRRGTGWVVDRLVELVEKWSPSAVVLDPAAPVGSLLPELAERGVMVTQVNGREMGQACGAFFDAVSNDRLRHLGQPSLNVALDKARKRPLGDAWAWHRRDQQTDLSPLVAATLALHGHSTGHVQPKGLTRVTGRTSAY